MLLHLRPAYHARHESYNSLFKFHMLRIGEIVNERYRIDQVLGEGGMGIVYLGWDLLAERFVALKGIKASSPDYQKYIEQVKKEVKAQAKLNHSNIVILYDLIQYQNNWYIIMEYVEGSTLEKKLEQSGALPHEEAIPIFKQMLAALEHAHDASVEHRDIKPGNVMITPEGQVKMMDFGLAKIQVSGSPTRSTKSEHTGGTLYYLSPEQVESEGKLADYRSDIYSLGMTCYEILTEYMPLKEKKTTVEILNAILQDNFPSPKELKATVPTELSEIIDKAIALKPGERFQSAKEMLAEVEKFEATYRNNNGVLARELSRKRRRIRLVLEIVWGIITVALVLALITIFAVPDLPLRMLRWTGIHSSTKVAIYTEPAGAKIKLEGKSAGKSPLRSRLVDVDTLRITIEESTYFSIDTSIVVKGAMDTTLFFRLQPAAIFTIEVAPESAEVVIDGKIIPPGERAHLELAVGEHDLRIASRGYESIDERISLRHGLNPPRADTLEQAMIAVLSTLPPKDNRKKPSREETKDVEGKVLTPLVPVEVAPRTGLLTLTINPPSEVYIGDSLAVSAATQARFTLARGKHTIKVVHATLGRWRETIMITEQSAAREIEFTKKYTVRVLAFDVAGKSLGASIYLDHQPTGQLTPYILPLIFGVHEIELRLEGYETARRELNVEKNEELEFKLERSP